MRQPIEWLMREYQVHLFVAAFNICKNTEDAKDVVQETFLAYHQSTQQFENEEHLRAWLFRVAVNKSKNITRTFWHRNRMPLEDYLEILPFETKGESDLFQAVLDLPEKYRIVVHLFYYEDYNIRDISQILHISEGSVKTRLSRGRKLLKDSLKEDWDDDE